MVLVLNCVLAGLLVSVVMPLFTVPMAGGELSTSLTVKAGGDPLKFAAGKNRILASART